jgi:glycosyltransferase involved in cell wall biosynthesis
MSTGVQHVKVSIIDGSVGNDYSVCLCSALYTAGVDVELIAPENRVMDVPVDYPIKRWMPTKDPKSGKIGKAIHYLKYLARLLVYVVRNRKEDRVAHFQFLRRERIECVFLLLLRLLGVRLVFTAHNVLPHENSPIDRLLLFGAYRAARRIIVHSEYMKNKLTKGFRIDREKVIVIPCGNFDHYIPIEPMSRAKARRDLSLSERDHVALFFGFIREYKGLDLLLDAFEICTAQGRPFRLVVAGGVHPSELEDRYRRRIDRISADGSIVFHAGFIPSEMVAAYFIGCDVVILPYKETDHSGIVHLAYSFGRPVIATDVGDFSEIIENGKTGYILEENNADCLARTLLRAFSRNVSLADMGAYARQKSDANYSWSEIALRTRNLYLTLGHSE